MNPFQVSGGSFEMRGKEVVHMITSWPREMTIAVHAHSAGDRSRLYQLLNLAYRYPGEDVIGALKENVSSGLLERIKETHLSLPSASEMIESFLREVNAIGDPYELQIEYTRLFIGPSHLPAPPYESVYRVDSRGLLMGNAATAVTKLYLEEGLALSPSISDLPDHILAELEFMSYLCEREASAWANETGKVEHYLRKQDTFLSDHVTQWLPPFARGIRGACGQGFYGTLGELTERLVLSDHDYIRALMRGLDGIEEVDADAHSL
jgi:TorA maturation chaperone TorD